MPPKRFADAIQLTAK